MFMLKRKMKIENNTFWFIVFAACCAVVSSIIGFVLCCCKTKCLYVTYLVIIILVILVGIAAIVLAFCFKNKILDGINENWYKDKYKESRKDIDENFDVVDSENGTSKKVVDTKILFLSKLQNVKIRLRKTSINRQLSKNL